jgi:hypothetical protein
MEILAIHTDTHPGSKLGLCPPEIELNDGGTYLSSKAQRWSWGCWGKYWDRVSALKKERKSRVGSISVGDAGDLNKHGSAQFVSLSKTDAKNIATSVYDRPSKIADYQIFVKGTAAHTGKSGWLEDWIAEDLEAVKDPETDSWSWWYARMQVEELLIEFYHRPQAVGRLPHTESNATNRMSNIIFQRCQRSGESVPDLVFFGHVHYYASSDPTVSPRVVYCPGWQLPYDFIFSIGGGHHSPRIGGLILVVEGKNHTIIDDCLYQPWRKSIWNPASLKKK